MERVFTFILGCILVMLPFHISDFAETPGHPLWYEYILAYGLAILGVAAILSSFFPNDR